MTPIAPATLLGGVRRAASPHLARRDPGALIVAGAAVVAALAPMFLLAPPDVAVALDDAQQMAATTFALLALVIAARRMHGEGRVVAVALGAALALIAMGMLLGIADPGAKVTATGPGDGLLAAGIAVFGGVMLWASGAYIERRRILPVALESLIVVSAVACIVGAVWPLFVDRSPEGRDTGVALVGAIAMVAGPGGTFLALLDRGAKPGLWGPFAVIGGLAICGIAWLGWQTLVAQGTALAVSPFDLAYSLAALLIAWGGLTWDRTPPTTERSARLARSAGDVFSIAAVGVCMVLALALPQRDGVDIVKLGAAFVVTLTVARQVLLVRSERTARIAERASRLRLAREIQHRAAVLASVASLAASDTPEATARDVCLHATSLAGIDWAMVIAIETDGPCVVLAEVGPCAPLPRGARRSPARSASLVEQATIGSWFEDLDDATDEHMVALRRAGIRTVASAPLVSQARVVGVMRLGSTGDDGEQSREERLSAAREFGAVAGALLVPGLDARKARVAARTSIAAIIATRGFHAVFQPIVELAGGHIVGYEALTRFADGMRPDHRFAEASAVGLGIELEVAALAAGLRDAAALPPDAYLSLNVSPELACDSSGIVAALAGIDRRLVLEITEHAPVGSYANLRLAMSTFGDHVRFAVDDAGAGFAGLQHILEVGPDIVKLDVVLVRGVDEDPARRALIRSMVEFARETHATVLAEGIETAAEADTLRALGVTLGQGYLFGRPARAVNGST